MGLEEHSDIVSQSPNTGVIRTASQHLSKNGISATTRFVTLASRMCIMKEVPSVREKLVGLEQVHDAIERIKGHADHYASTVQTPALTFTMCHALWEPG